MIERLEHLADEYWQLAMDAFARVNATDGDHRLWIRHAKTLLKQWEVTTGLVEQMRERERENDDIRHFYSAGGITRPIYDDGGDRA